MTFREKLKIEEPDRVYETAIGGCEGCPIDKEGKGVCVVTYDAKCRKCWDREIPEKIKEHDKIDAVHDPSHYQGGNGMDCMEEMILIFGIDAVIEFCKCNIYKYRYRSENKNGKQDIEKAENYAVILRRLQERKGVENAG